MEDCVVGVGMKKMRGIYDYAQFSTDRSLDGAPQFPQTVGIVALVDYFQCLSSLWPYEVDRICQCARVVFPTRSGGLQDRCCTNGGTSLTFAQAIARENKTDAADT